MTSPDARSPQGRPRYAAWAAALIAIVIAASACGTTAALSTPADSVLAPSPVATTATSGPIGTTGAVATPGQATATSVSAFAPTGQMTEASVVRVVDGDTIVVAYGGKQFKVRYIGMNTPETVDPSRPIQWMGPEASAANKALVIGKTVVLEKDVSETDRYGRLLRYVWLTDGAAWTLVNLALIQQGFASVSTYPPDVKYVDVYVSAEREAQAGAIGLWGEVPSIHTTPAPTVKSTPKATSPSSKCHPSYDPCLPIVGDLDCPEIRAMGKAPVTVKGPDDYRLDRDGDGIGCE
jgi:micrococcal nuclease